jgi:DNA modification methylase
MREAKRPRRAVHLSLRGNEMRPYYQDDEVTVHHGDCLALLPRLPDESMDAVVTDPPYGLDFMGKHWDTGAVAFDVETWRQCLRVLKPGGHLLAFGGTRTFHRLAVAVEDSGFVIRDSIAWLYGSGFPKSLNLPGGLGTALKPAFEPIVVARKSIRGTVAANVAEYGTGTLNVDGCRVGTEGEIRRVNSNPGIRGGRFAAGRYESNTHETKHTTAGRWPTNVVIDEVTADGIDAESGITRDGVAVNRNRGDVRPQTVKGVPRKVLPVDRGYGGEGGASRFFPTFRYEAKAPTSERPTANGVAHPTVKPLDLMRWLVRLVTPPGGLVLDPFAGSGTTAEACIHEHMRCITIEREADYLPLIVARLSKAMAVGFDFGSAS